MGIVQKQSIKGSVIIYLGIVLGFINTGLIFPKVLTTEQIGLLNILISYSTIIGLFGNLGFTNTIIKFFPYFKEKDEFHNGFLKIITIISFIGFILSLLLFVAVKSFLIKSGTEKSALFFEYIYLLIPLIFFTIYFNAYDAYYRALFNSVQGVFYKEFATRIIVLASILLFIFNIISFKHFIYSYVFAYSLPAIGITISIIKGRQFKFSRKKLSLKLNLKKSMISVSLFSIISGFSGVLLINIDRIMLERFYGLSEVGVYSIAFFFGTIVGIFARPVSRIASALIADYWKQKDMNKIREIYKSTAVNQFIIGTLILVGIWANIHNVFRILPNEYIDAKYVIFIIGLAFLVDMLAGSSVNILAFSSYYKYHTYIMLVFIAVAILSNLLLIPKMGIEGAAIATLVSKMFYNTIRGIFLYYKYKLNPYNISFLIIIMIGGLSYWLSLSIPIMSNIFLDLFIRSSIIVAIFISLIYLFRVSTEINQVLRKIFSRV